MRIILDFGCTLFVVACWVNSLENALVLLETSTAAAAAAAAAAALDAVDDDHEFVAGAPAEAILPAIVAAVNAVSPEHDSQLNYLVHNTLEGYVENQVHSVSNHTHVRFEVVMMAGDCYCCCKFFFVPLLSFLV